ncbi:hypothetical protein V5O48_002312 [Marasmius crinis-equi]|uniref:Cytochrome P450 n=1 Tax=Marasmius crinis-equi TaxID=585013 RepID=A0ABR3FWH8_9AGAR
MSQKERESTLRGLLDIIQRELEQPQFQDGYVSPPNAPPLQMSDTNAWLPMGLFLETKRLTFADVIFPDSKELPPHTTPGRVDEVPNGFRSEPKGRPIAS